jgi:hypothetical protein
MGRLRNAVTRDQGSSALDYLAVIALVAAIGAGLFAIGLPTTITNEAERQICRIIGRSGCGVTPPPQATRPDPDKPQQVAGPDPYEPQQDCWTDITDRTVELAVTQDTPWWVAARVGRRVTTRGCCSPASRS